MKALHFFFPVLLFGIFTSCNSNSSHNVEHSDSSHKLDTSASAQGMSMPMDEMMKEMHVLEMTGNVDVDFAMMMKSHHKGAVDMAQEELENGMNDTVKALAEKIVDAQKSEIEELDRFISNHRKDTKNYDTSNKTEGFASVIDKSMQMMMGSSEPEKGSADKQFLEMMIPHHQSAVYMAEGFLKYGKDESLKEMARKMIAEQNKEIAEMKGITAD